ncbi:MAG: hypothetical protein J2P41_00185 [Blastocatellia bacterium]|nr:hypothetical protein [Blastocatellia bacterium]
MSEDEAKQIAEKIFTTSSGIRAAKLLQADPVGGVIDELDLDTVAELIREGAPEDEDDS